MISEKRPVVFAGPSGVGKGTIIGMLMKRFPGFFAFSVSHTTRKPRDGEQDGIHYNFTTTETMKEDIDGEKFIEFANVHGNLYGTSFDAVKTVAKSGKVCILDIDVQGVQNVKNSTLDPYYIFVAPPSMEALESRLRGRGTESEEDITKRIVNASVELEYGKGDGNFDFVLTNNVLEESFEALVEKMKSWYFDLSETNNDMPRPMIVCGPSGVGKGTLIEMLMKRFPREFQFSVSHTTRMPRHGEKDGVHYNFTTLEEMKGMIDAGEFIEHANVHGRFYGTSFAAVETVQKAGKVCILDIDVQGVQTVKESSLDPHYVFVAPPSMEVLEARLRGRGTESEDDTRKRLENAAGELEYSKEEGNFDFVLTNDVLEDSFEKLVEKMKGWYPKLAEVENRGPRPVVLCGPSGVGKGTLIDMLMKRFPDDFQFSVSHTTRFPRDGEKDGLHYTFTTAEKMKNDIDAGKFIEHANVHGKFNGTSFAAVETVQKSGKVCILDIDVQGVGNVKKSELDPHYVFVAPPSMEALESRLRGRGTESEEDTKKRLENAAGELEYGNEAGNFDYVLTNDVLEESFEKLVKKMKSWYPKLADAENRGPRPVVLCGPSGVGKGTLIDMLMKRFPDDFQFSVSHTTRNPRDGEKDGVHYNFTTVEKMKDDIEAGKFIEHANVHGKFYGTSFAAVETVQKSGKVCILDIDVQGVRNVKKSALDPYYVFVAPPSMEALESRLRGRGTESEEDTRKRLENAAGELEYGNEEGNFDFVLTNDVLEGSFEKLVEKMKSWYPKLADAENRGPRPVVLCGPSGVGKGTLIDMLMKCFPDNFQFSVSHTTRNPRDGEKDGVHYNFTTVEKIKEDIDAGKFIEYANVHGKFYGTSFAAVETVRKSGKVCILDIDVQGVQNLKKSKLGPYYVFVAPPSIEELESRLRGRGTESEDNIKQRLDNAAYELEYGREEGNFDFILTNDVLETSFEKLVQRMKVWYPKLIELNIPLQIHSQSSNENVENGVFNVPRPIVICGPSGVGKGTLIDMLMKQFPEKFHFSVSHTTRQPREGEVDGVHYHFTALDKMKKDIDEGKFVEYADVHGRYYGTSFAAVEAVQTSGKVCILDIDVQGVKNVKKSHLKPHYVFVAPPSLEELEARLRGRGTESEEEVKKRLDNAQGELSYGMGEGNFDFVLKNDVLEKSYDELLRVVKEWYPKISEVVVPFQSTTLTDAYSSTEEDDAVRGAERDPKSRQSTMLRPVIFCGPSGVGKGTLIELLMNQFPDNFQFSVSHTTRKPRDGEEEGVHYYFTDAETMEKEIGEGKFIEFAYVHGKHYGTSFSAVEKVQKSGKICILDIDIQGVQNVKKSTLNPHYIFVAPPSKDELECRLRGRGTESEDDIAKRLKNADEELKYGWTDGNFDLVLTNDELEASFRELVNVMNQWYPDVLNARVFDEGIIPRVCQSCSIS